MDRDNLYMEEIRNDVKQLCNERKVVNNMENNIDVKLLRLEKEMKTHVSSAIAAEKTSTWTGLQKTLLLYEHDNIGTKKDIKDIYDKINHNKAKSDAEHSKAWSMLDTFKNSLNDKTTNKSLYIILGGLLTITMGVFFFIATNQTKLEERQNDLLIVSARIEERISKTPDLYRSVDEITEIIKKVVRKSELD